MSSRRLRRIVAVQVSVAQWGNQALPARDKPHKEDRNEERYYTCHMRRIVKHWRGLEHIVTIFMCGFEQS